MVNPKKGIWIAFEGNDGSGKTTQLKKVAEYLKKSGHQVIEIREPGGNPYSEEIRNLLFRDEVSGDPRTQLLLFTAARRRNILSVILPALISGAIVLSDRCELSTFAYQQFQFGLPPEEILEINNFATDGIKPDVVILLDVEIEIAKNRLVQNKAKKTNHFDEASEMSWIKRKEGYLKLAKENNNVFTVNANLSEEKVFENIISLLRKIKII
jgi:dTMP kinase